MLLGAELSAGETVNVLALVFMLAIVYVPGIVGTVPEEVSVAVALPEVKVIAPGLDAKGTTNELEVALIIAFVPV